MSAILKADNIFVDRDRHAILTDVSLSIGERDFVTVIGPNGAGKTTLIKCMLGFFKPDKGRIHKDAALNIGYLPQKLMLDKAMPLRAKQFLLLRNGMSNVWDTVIEETETHTLLERPLYSLSGGQLQRILLARALLREPQILVLDEPAQNLDISNQRKFYEVLRRIYENRAMAVLMVSHDLHFVMSCTNHVVCLYHHVCCSGAPHTITQEPEFISLFGDDFGRLMSVYHHHHAHSHTHETESEAEDGNG